MPFDSFVFRYWKHAAAPPCRAYRVTWQASGGAKGGRECSEVQWRAKGGERVARAQFRSAATGGYQVIVEMIFNDVFTHTHTHRLILHQMPLSIRRRTRYETGRSDWKGWCAHLFSLDRV